MTSIQVARLAHETNRVYCSLLGDSSQPTWEAAPNWQRDSAIKGVEFHLDNPNAGPEASHNEWFRVKLAEGWKYGETKDPERKEHPCCVPYEDLPIEQKIKDTLFISIVHSLKPLL
jgi:hypothetical protein